MIKNGKVAKDFVYTSSALILINIVLQLLIYPLINNKYGPDFLGNIVSQTGIVYALCASTGGAISNEKLLIRKKYEKTNNDFNIIIFCFCVILFAALFVYSIISIKVLSSAFLLSLVGCLVFLRYYSEVQFRLDKNFKGYLLYYIIVSIGYIIGYFLFIVTGIWYLIFIVGESLAVLYVLIKGNIYKLEKSSSHLIEIFKLVIVLAGSYLLGAFAVHYYKIFLNFCIDSTAVTVYYVGSFFGKSLDLVITPITTLIISYLTAASHTKKIDFSSKKSLLIIGLVGVVLYVGFVVATPIYSYIFYNNLYAEVWNINFVVNIAQTFSAISSILIVLLLVEFGAKTHFIVQSIYVITYVVFSSLLALKFGIMGFAIGASIGFITKFILIIFVSKKSKTKKEKVCTK